MTLQFFEYYNKASALEAPRFRYCPLCATALIDIVLEQHTRGRCPACGYIQHLNPAPGICVLVENEGKVLIGKRAAKSVRGGMWCLPCGYIDYEENYLQAAHREVFEETHLKIKLTSLMDVFSSHISPGHHSLVPIVTATVIGGSPQPGDDIVELRWLTPKCELPEMAFQSDPITIERYFSGDFLPRPIDPRYEVIE